jgi:hypothetical protein
MSLRLSVLVVGLSVGLLSPDAVAATPRVVGRPVVRNPSFTGTPNTMMYTVRVTVDGTGADADHAAVVGFVSDDDYTTCGDAATPWKWGRTQTYDDSDTRTWTLYNFVPGTTYHYKFLVGDPAGTTRMKCGILQTAAAPTPTLPANLSYLNLQYQISGTSEAKYVLLETEDCGTGGGPNGSNYYVVVVDPANEAIVWYLDVSAATGLVGIGSGLNYEAAASPADDRIHMTVSKEAMYEWTFDGTATRVYDFGSAGECNGLTGSVGPCVHHDIVRSDTTGNTYAIAARLSSVDPTDTAWDARCDTTSRFLDEGYLVLDSDWSLTSQNFLITDIGYDPTVDGGPSAKLLAGASGSCDSRHWVGHFDPAYGVIDWLHENALSVSSFDGPEVVDISLKEWDQIIRFDAATGARLWSLSPHRPYSDWGSVRIAPGVAGPATFDSQHDVNAVGPNLLMLVDNRGDPSGSRLLEIELTDHPPAATIQKSWAIVDGSGDPIRCSIEGTAQRVPGSSDDHVLTACNDEYAIVEMDDPTGGTGTPPPLYIWLPDGTPDAFCTSGGPAERRDLAGWHKGYPMARVGEF